jgi:ubiquinone biosynthesis monooxygenase Coq7
MLDNLIIAVESTLKTLFPPLNREGTRDNPAKNIPESSLTDLEKQHIAGLMRVNHAGEVAAQALYLGHSLTARKSTIKQLMNDAMHEEICHLAWCETRLKELGGQPSFFNPLWFIGSLAIGMLAGALGDKVSLGFVAETERQVEQHLDTHIQAVPSHDLKTLAILKKMQEDELRHEENAVLSGAVQFPFVIQCIMALTSKVMTKSSYYM